MKKKSMLIGIAIGLAVGFALTLIVVSGGLPLVTAGCSDEPCLKPPCCNGDVNGDADVDISDAVYLLNHLFLGGPPPHEIQGGGDPCDVDVAGKWNVDVSYRPNTCQMAGPLVPVTVSVQQEGCQIVVVSDANPDIRFGGVVCGDIAYWGGEFPYMNATVRLDSHMTIGPRDTIEGMTSWTVKTDLDTCQGVEVWTASRAQ